MQKLYVIADVDTAVLREVLDYLGGHVYVAKNRNLTSSFVTMLLERAGCAFCLASCTTDTRALNQRLKTNSNHTV